MQTIVMPHSPHLMRIRMIPKPRRLKRKKPLLLFLVSHFLEYWFYIGAADLSLGAPKIWKIQISHFFKNMTGVKRLLWTGAYHRQPTVVSLDRRKFTKGGFFSEIEMKFFQISRFRKKYSKKLSWAWNLNFKFRIVFFNILFFDSWRSEKNESHFLKKSHL